MFHPGSHARIISRSTVPSPLIITISFTTPSTTQVPLHTLTKHSDNRKKKMFGGICGRKWHQASFSSSHGTLGPRQIGLAGNSERILVHQLAGLLPAELQQARRGGGAACKALHFFWTPTNNQHRLQEGLMDSNQPNGMVFYAELAVDEKRLAEEIGKILQLRIAPVSALDPEAQIVYWPESIEGSGFPSGIVMTWGRTVNPRLDYIDVALQLSRNLGARVATDVPEGLPESGDPCYWLIADPSGSLRIIGEDMKFKDAFILDETDSFPFLR